MTFDTLFHSKWNIPASIGAGNSCVQGYLHNLHSWKHASDLEAFMIQQLSTNCGKIWLGPESTTLTHWWTSVVMTTPAMR